MQIQSEVIGKLKAKLFNKKTCHAFAIARLCVLVKMHFRKNNVLFLMGIAMLTKIGNQVLNELKSELDTDVEDQKFEFILSNGKSIFREFICWTGMCFILFSFSFSLVMFFTIYTIDAATIESLKQVSVEGWLNTRSVVLLITVAVFCMLLFITIIFRFSRYKTAKARYEDENIQYLTETKHRIELIEEVLYRHKLISKQDK